MGQHGGFGIKQMESSERTLAAPQMLLAQVRLTMLVHVKCKSQMVGSTVVNRLEGITLSTKLDSWLLIGVRLGARSEVLMTLLAHTPRSDCVIATTSTLVLWWAATLLSKRIR